MKDTIIEMRKSIMNKIESLEASSEQVDALRKDFKNLSKELNTEIKILNHQIQKNEDSIESLTRAHRELRSYVVDAIESHDDEDWFYTETTPRWKRCVNYVSSFCESHGPIIAYTLLLSGLIASLTYSIMTRIL